VARVETVVTNWERSPASLKTESTPAKQAGLLIVPTNPSYQGQLQLGASFFFGLASLAISRFTAGITRFPSVERP
jgi:hypothetical protein